eukprot:TRINITY_DN10918_c0_g1_i1.p1 TRINITY_DN10918_c0_g1~~TRINITY_DN10918_c0_g1_i1.p1  ORF type:complete len:485 (+),score=87.08 TRINITY_DN10918_c0_g1_i1:206-1660(+)
MQLALATSPQDFSPVPARDLGDIAVLAAVAADAVGPSAGAEPTARAGGTRKWTEEERNLLLDGLRTLGSDWDALSKHVGGTKTPTQCKTFFNHNYRKTLAPQLGYELNKESPRSLPTPTLSGVLQSLPLASLQSLCSSLGLDSTGHSEELTTDILAHCAESRRGDEFWIGCLQMPGDQRQRALSTDVLTILRRMPLSQLSQRLWKLARRRCSSKASAVAALFAYIAEHSTERDWPAWLSTPVAPKPDKPSATPEPAMASLVVSLINEAEPEPPATVTTASAVMTHVPAPKRRRLTTATESVVPAVPAEPPPPVVSSSFAEETPAAKRPKWTLESAKAQISADMALLNDNQKQRFMAWASELLLSSARLRSPLAALKRRQREARRHKKSPSVSAFKEAPESPAIASSPKPADGTPCELRCRQPTALKLSLFHSASGFARHYSTKAHQDRLQELQDLRRLGKTDPDVTWEQLDEFLTKHGNAPSLS